MPEYNAAFFGLYENLFLTLKEELGEPEALRLFSAVVGRGLKSAYDKTRFQKGSTRDFARVVGEIYLEKIGVTERQDICEEETNSPSM